MKCGSSSLHGKRLEEVSDIFMGALGDMCGSIQVKRLFCMLTMQLAMKLHKHPELHKTSSHFPETTNRPNKAHKLQSA